MRLEITCQDRLGITQDVLDILVAHSIDLRGIEIDPVGIIYLNFPNIEFEDFQHLMPKIRRIDGIDDVKTTSYMPVEREKHQLRAVLQTLPDPVFSIDKRGVISQINDAIETGLNMQAKDILGREISEFVKGFNFLKWLDGKAVLAQAHKLKFTDQDYLADILPIYISDAEDAQILAGAVVLLKSELRLGQQLNAFNQPKSNRFDNMLAQSSSMKRTVKEARAVAKEDNPILLRGEAGSGKQTLAKACHLSSPRAKEEFLSLDCAGLSAEQIELELFGCSASVPEYPEGKSGLIELAGAGSLFIKEVTDIPMPLQSRLFRAATQKMFTRVGDTKSVPTQVRLICGTSMDISDWVSQQRFREDFYYLISAMSIVIPPLRERKADVLSLAEWFIQQYCIRLGRPLVRLSGTAGDFLQNYPWPGNVKQLESTLNRALTQLEGNELTQDLLQLPSNVTTVSFVDQSFEGSLDDEVKKFEKDLLQRLYPFYPSTRQLAKKLGLSHTAIANKLRDYGISKATLKL